MMEPTAALALVNRIETVWPEPRWSQLRNNQWAEALADIDEGAAGTAFARLRATATRCPSIAEFIAAARSLNTNDRSTRDPDCEHCDNTGWEEMPEIEINGHPYTQVGPCQCRRGQAARATCETINRANGHSAPRAAA
jgi:hypothetical protein